MDESIRHAGRPLVFRQRESGLRVEYRKTGIIHLHTVLLFRLDARYDGVAVHLRRRSRQCHHIAERQDFPDEAAVAHQIPGIAVVTHGGRYQFRPVEYGTASDREQKIHPLALALCDRLAERLYFGIGFDAPELDVVAAGQCRRDLFVHTVLLHASAAEGHHDFHSNRYLCREAGYHPFAEYQFGRVLKNEVLHAFSPN